MVPRCIHINIPRMAETWVTRFIEKSVCWDQVKSVNGRIVELESTRMGTWENWFIDQMGTYSTICRFEAVSGCDNLPIYQSTNLPIHQVTNLPSCICSKSAIFRCYMETWVPRFEQIKVPWNIGKSEDGLMGVENQGGQGETISPL
jgi:hypothetical protein